VAATARTAFVAASGVGATLALGAAILVAARGARADRLVDACLRGWAACWLRPAGVRVEVVGRHNIGAGTAYVVVSNHQSNLDPIVHAAVFSGRVRFLAMRGLFDLPLLGPVLRRAGMVEVDRRDPDGHGIAVGTARALRSGSSVLVYPEGGTQGDGVVGAFRSGAFRLAVENRAPVLPIATSGTRQAWPTDRSIIRPARVRVVVGAAIDTRDLTAGDVPAMRDRIRRWIVDAVDAAT
jgi:1-acyl-sn-glycerol-3-phosphate acyltransferase